MIRHWEGHEVLKHYFKMQDISEVQLSNEDGDEVRVREMLEGKGGFPHLETH